MIVVCSDTHSNGSHELTDHMLDAISEADRLIHAGDFTTVSALEAFHEEATRLEAVFGNADDPSVRDRLPPARTVEWEGLRIAVTHRRDGGGTGLEMFGRERGADLVISGHSHRPSITRADDLVLLNPGSHAQPRGNRPGYAELEPVEEGVRCRLRQPDGTLIEEATL
ncbi:metallophosphoesterase [Halalkalicoccus ordinarius]|uniref:metallophosphoesterase n=1 Tax=Halalkalicoccus ordinarius TaxID=3116651 RepID=UPI00300EC272